MKVDWNQELGQLLLGYCTKEEWEGFNATQKTAALGVAFITKNNQWKLADIIKTVITAGHNYVEIPYKTGCIKIGLTSYLKNASSSVTLVSIDDLVDKVTLMIPTRNTLRVSWGTPDADSLPRKSPFNPTEETLQSVRSILETAQCHQQLKDVFLVDKALKELSENKMEDKSNIEDDLLNSQECKNLLASLQKTTGTDQSDFTENTETYSIATLPPDQQQPPSSSEDVNSHYRTNEDIQVPKTPTSSNIRRSKSLNTMEDNSNIELLDSQEYDKPIGNLQKTDTINSTDSNENTDPLSSASTDNAHSTNPSFTTIPLTSSNTENSVDPTETPTSPNTRRSKSFYIAGLLVVAVGTYAIWRAMRHYQISPSRFPQILAKKQPSY